MLCRDWLKGVSTRRRGGDHLLCPVQVAPATRPMAYGARGRWIRCLRLTKIRREIGTLKLLKHPNVVRLQEVSASKTKIYMVLEYVTGGELFDKIASRGRFPEHEGRKLFQQLIDAVSYCHGKGVYHRDLKPENVLVDAKGNIKVSDFDLSALPQHLGSDGLLHTTCGSPNYVAPEVLANRDYDGSTSDIWSCGVILYVILTGCLPFDDVNLAVLYQKVSSTRKVNRMGRVKSERGRAFPSVI